MSHFAAARRRAYADPARRMDARYPGACASCGASISKGDRMVWDAYNRRALCLKDTCGPQRERDTSADRHDQAVYDGGW